MIAALLMIVLLLLLSDLSKVRSHLFRYTDVLFASCIVRMYSMRKVHLRNLDLNLLVRSTSCWRNGTSHARRNEVS